MNKRDEAIKLRKQGTSLGDISKHLSIAKSTTSIWCRNVTLSKKAQSNLKKLWLEKTQLSRAKGTLMNKNKKIQAKNEAKIYAEKLVPKNLTSRELLIAGLMLYWAEGSKSEKTSGFMFINSDPIMLIFIIKFITQILHIPKAELVCDLQINISHQRRANEVLNYWQDMLELPLSQFRGPHYVRTPHKRQYENHNTYYGIIRLGVRKSRNLKYRMIESINVLKLLCQSSSVG